MNDEEKKDRAAKNAIIKADIEANGTTVIFCTHIESGERTPQCGIDIGESRLVIVCQYCYGGFVSGIIKDILKEFVGVLGFAPAAKMRVEKTPPAPPPFREGYFTGLGKE